MFEVSWSETIVVLLVGLIVLGPEQLAVVIKNIKALIAKMKKMGSELTSSITGMEEFTDLKKEAEKLNKDINMIVDMDGNLQPTYDISDILKEAEERKNKG